MGIILFTKDPKHTKPTHKMYTFEDMPAFFAQMMNNPEFKAHWNNKSRGARRCGRKFDNENSAPPNKICIPLRRFSPEQVQLSMSKAGLMTITASKETTEDSSRNDQRKTTVLVEETCQLPGYLVDNGMLEKVDSKFHCGCLVVTFPEDPKVTEEREFEESKKSPTEIPIMMEE